MLKNNFGQKLVKKKDLKMKTRIEEEVNLYEKHLIFYLNYIKDMIKEFPDDGEMHISLQRAMGSLRSVRIINNALKGDFTELEDITRLEKPLPK